MLILDDDLKREFEKRKPWITKFLIEGKEYGGNYDALGDHRVNQFWQFFPNARLILELGSLEGGHTFALARHSEVKRILGVEGRQANVDKAMFVQELLGVSNAEFMTANLENFDLSSLGRFDAVFCVGVLYHLPNPLKLIKQISEVTENLFLWTHYVEEEQASDIINGVRGAKFGEEGLSDPLSGLSATSFRLTFDCLLDVLRANGFKNIHIIEKVSNHPFGPCTTLAASSQTIVRSR